MVLVWWCGDSLGSINYVNNWQTAIIDGAPDNPQIVTLQPLHLTVGTVCFFNNAVFVLCHTLRHAQLPKSSTSVSSVHIIFCPNYYVTEREKDKANQEVFLANDVHLGTPPWVPFLPSLFLISKSWNLTEWGLQLNIVLSSFKNSW